MSDLIQHTLTVGVAPEGLTILAVSGTKQSVVMLTKESLSSMRAILLADHHSGNPPTHCDAIHAMGYQLLDSVIFADCYTELTNNTNGTAAAIAIRLKHGMITQEQHDRMLAQLAGCKCTH